MVPQSIPETRTVSLTSRLLPWLVLVLGLFASTIAWNLARESQMQDVKADFTSRTDRATVEIRKRLLAYEQVLRGGVALVDANGLVSRLQWRAYVERLDIGKSLPGVQGIGFAKLVNDEDKAAHIRAVRTKGLPGYDIRPEGKRSFYLPVVYLEPFSTLVPRAIGFDMSVEPVRRAAMERARDQGAFAISGNVRWIQEADGKEQSGFMMYLPVYLGGKPPEDLEPRRLALIGYVYAAFRMDNLVDGALNAVVDGIDLEIFDSAVPTRESLLFDLDRIPRFLGSPSVTDLSRMSTLYVDGRTWNLRYEALPAFVARNSDTRPLAVLTVSGLISLLLFALTWSASHMRKKALTLAEGMSAALQENEQRFTGIFQSAMDAIISVDEKQMIVHFNPAAELIFRCRAAQAVGSPLTRFMPPRFRDAHAHYIERFGVTGVTDRQMGSQRDLFGLRADGDEFPLEASISQTAQAGKKIYTVMLRDISARKRDELALRNSEQRFRGLVEVSPAAILIHQDDKIVFANSAAVALFGASDREQLIGDSLQTRFQQDSETSARQSPMFLLTGAPVSPAMERRIMRLDGEIRFVEVTTSAFEDAGRPAVLEMMHDVTDRYLAREELQRSHEELRQLGAALEQARESERKRIAQELHDDLGQTLTVLKMDMSSLKAQLTGADSDSSANTRLLDDLSRMDGLLNDTVQSVRQISANLRPQLLDDLGLATALEALLKQVSRSSGLRCTFDLDPTRLSIDERLAAPLYRIAQEALNNVVKHANATEVKLSLSVDVSNATVLAIQDNGKGMRPEDKRKPSSFGLIGMRERAFALGGDLLIESTSGNGTLIRISIPNPGNVGSR